MRSIVSRMSAARTLLLLLSAAVCGTAVVSGQQETVNVTGTDVEVLINILINSAHNCPATTTSPINPASGNVLCTIFVVPPSSEQPSTVTPTVPQPISTQQSTAQPSNSQPISAQPSSAQTSSVQPISVQPTTTQPSSAQPISAQPSSAQPSNSQPTSAQQSTAQPSSSQPISAQLSSAQPSNSQPINAQPSSAQPISAQPSSALPSTTGPTPLSISAQPSNVQPGNSQPNNAQPGNSQPNNSQPINSQPGSSQPNNSQPINSQPGSSQPNNSQPINPQPGVAGQSSAPPNVMLAAVQQQQTTESTCAALCTKLNCFAYQVQNISSSGELSAPSSTGNYLVVVGYTPGAPTEPTYLCTSSTTPTTTTTTTEAPLPPNATQVAFSAGSTSPFSQDGGTIPLSTVTSNYNNHFTTSSNQFQVAGNAMFFVEACAGVGGSQTANIRVAGSSPLTIGMTWDATSQNGVETQCRGSLLQSPHGTDLSLVLDSGSVTSDNNTLIMFTTFSISDSMSDDALSKLVYATATTTPPVVNETLTPIPMTTVIPSTAPSFFDQSKAKYTCPSTGLYFASASAGILMHTPTELQINNSGISVGLTRTSPGLDGVTTIYRNNLVQCQQGDTIQYNVLSGTVADWDGEHGYNLTTFTVFPYDPRSATPIAWAVYKWYISFNNQPGKTTVLDPFEMSNVTVNEGAAYQESDYTMTAPVSGYYFTCVSCGAGVGLSGSTFTLQLVTGTQVVFGIEHKSTITGATDMFSRCAVVYFDQGQTMRLVGLAGSYFYSSVMNYEVSWIGMLLYQTSGAIAPAGSSTQPSNSQPSAQPISSQPISAQPSSAQPISAQPNSSQPISAQPSSSQPISAQSSSAQPVSVQPSSAQPSSSQPIVTPLIPK
jgi:hypothetical protein